MISVIMCDKLDANRSEKKSSFLIFIFRKVSRYKIAKNARSRVLCKVCKIETNLKIIYIRMYNIKYINDSNISWNI